MTASLLQLALLLLKRSPGLCVQNSSVQLFPTKLHVGFLLCRKDVDINEAGFDEDFPDAIEREVWDDDRIGHFLQEFRRRVVGVVVPVVWRGVLVVVVLMLVLVVVLMGVGVSVVMIMAVTVYMTVAVTVAVVMAVAMFVYSMISLGPRNRLTIFINLEIASLDKIRNHNRSTRPDPSLQLLRRKHDVFEVVKAKADSRQVEALPLGA